MQRLRDLAISETGFVFDPFSGATYTANGTALCVLDAMKKGASRGAIVETLRERFEVGGEDVARDLDELIQSIRAFGLIPPDFEVP